MKSFDFVTNLNAQLGEKAKKDVGLIGLKKMESRRRRASVGDLLNAKASSSSFVGFESHLRDADLEVEWSAEIMKRDKTYCE